jgi:hypothetical protein
MASLSVPMDVVPLDAPASPSGAYQSSDAGDTPPPFPLADFMQESSPTPPATPLRPSHLSQRLMQSTPTLPQAANTPPAQAQNEGEDLTPLWRGNPMCYVPASRDLGKCNRER